MVNYGYIRIMFRVLTILCIFLSPVLFGQENRVWLHPNKGQWDEHVDYQVELAGGRMYIEGNRFTYDFYTIPERHHHTNEKTPHKVGRHVVRANFLAAQKPTNYIEKEQSDFYRNYFLGSDPSKWHSGLYASSHVVGKQIYPHTDLEFKGGESTLKYSWILDNKGDYTQIKWEYEGASGVEIKQDGSIQINHSLGYFTEGKPVAWVLKDGVKIFVEVAYKLEKGQLSFQLGKLPTDYQSLIIDPTLTFSTFSGSTADNWGFTAAPDEAGNLFGGGIVFATGYPLTAGAYDMSFAGGTVDIGITKFTKKGDALLYSTYLGGASSETPHSIVSSPSGELFVFGVTSSNDFPVSANAFDNSFNGGFSTKIDGLNFENGTDIYVAKLSADGKSLLASTFVGGNSNDGVNTSDLNFNYGDQFRGEIIYSEGSIYVASSSESSNFPATGGGQNSLSGTMDAAVFKMPETLSTLTWCSFLGGSGVETGNGIQIAKNGNLFVAGGSTSPNMGFATGHDLSASTTSDGYVARINSTTGAKMSGTFIGLAGYDQTYFVQLDLSDNVYVLGQSATNMTPTAGKYSNPNSGQFVMKYTNDLTTRIWNTCIGASTGNPELSPSAFLVSDCNEIYIAGWGGKTNFNNSANTTSTTNGFPVTSDAFQNTTTGSNFWIGVLASDATELRYGTFMGGPNGTAAGDHVDGGTSRFDKSGAIYHAVCGACGGIANGFTTTPGVWSPTNKSTNCNLAAFKFELNKIEADVEVGANLYCTGSEIVIQNTSKNGDVFFWDFGDGTTSTQFNPTHSYSTAGTYTIFLRVSDSEGCFSADSITFELEIAPFPGLILNPGGTVCPNTSVQLEASGGTSYLWFPATAVSNTTIPNPIGTVSETTTIYCFISATCGSDTLSTQIVVNSSPYTLPNDTVLCDGGTLNLPTTGFTTVSWSPATYLDDATSMNPLCTPLDTIVYSFSGETTAGCTILKQIEILVQFGSPAPQLADTLKYCKGTSGEASITGADSYSWSPPVFISSTTASNVQISNPNPGYYYCLATNTCETVRDSIYVEILQASIGVIGDPFICIGDSTILTARGAVSYQWSPEVNPLESSYENVYAGPAIPTTYKVIGTDSRGCVDTAFFDLGLYPRATVHVYYDETVHYIGDIVSLNAQGNSNGTYLWTPPISLSCTTCPSTLANPRKSTNYKVIFTDGNGCVAIGKVKLFYSSLLHVPNTFTPDGDKFNNTFFAEGTEINDFHMEIFNRWGELMFESDDMNVSWDGKFNGESCKEGVYVWTIEYVDAQNEKQELTGHVTLLK